jgi:hypothetical protein
VLHSVLANLCRIRQIFRAVLPAAAILALLCASLTIFANGSLAQQGSFVLTGTMNTARTEQATATLLNNGKVLVAGGEDSNLTPLSGAELFDPVTGTFAPTGTMNTSRTQHTATLLANGKVLIAGGAGGAGLQPLSSAELYDPTTGTFTLTGSMNDGHSQYTATLLNNGKVLIASGQDSNGTTTTAEIYDPVAGTFTLTGSLNTGRSGHTSTLLSNGKVLIAGGFIENVGETATAELYDPAAGTFTNTGSLNTGRFAQTANLLSTGNVLIAGGVGGIGGMAGGVSGNPLINLTNAELYNATTGTFSTTGSLNIARSGHTATLLNDGAVLFAGGGGDVNSSNSLATAEIYDPAAGTFAFTGSLNTARQAHTATLLSNGTVLMAGGQPTDGSISGLGALASAELYILVGISPSSVSFANQTVGVASASQTAVLTNGQTSALTITGVTVSGANASNFSQMSNCVGNVAPGATCSLHVAFTPSALGGGLGNVNIAITAPAGSLSIPLTGTGATAPLVSVAPTTITFPAQFVGTSGLPQSVTVTNGGGTTLNITGVTTSTNDFGMLNACGSTVAAGSSCAIGVFFDPTASGTRTGTLTIADNAGSSPQTVTLTGSGQDFSMSAGATSSATVSPGQTANFSVAVAPAGGFAQSVTLNCSGVPAGSTCTVTPKTISLSGTAAQMAMVTVTTSGQGQMLPIGGVGPTSTKYRPMQLLLACVAMFFVTIAASMLRRRGQGLRCAPAVALALLACITMALTSCGGGSAGSGGGGTQAGTFTIAVTGSFSSGATTLTHGANLTLVVK